MVMAISTFTQTSVGQLAALAVFTLELCQTISPMLLNARSLTSIEKIRNSRRAKLQSLQRRQSDRARHEALSDTGNHYGPRAQQDNLCL